MQCRHDELGYIRSNLVDEDLAAVGVFQDNTETDLVIERIDPYGTKRRLAHDGYFERLEAPMAGALGSVWLYRNEQRGRCDARCRR